MVGDDTDRPGRVLVLSGVNEQVRNAYVIMWVHQLGYSGCHSIDVGHTVACKYCMAKL